MGRNRSTRRKPTTFVKALTNSFFNTIRLDLSYLFIVLTRNHKWLSLKPLWKITKRHDASRKIFFSYNSKTLPNVKTSWRNDYFFKKKILLFSRRNTNFKILSFRAIYFSDGVFNLTMLKWLDITNFIFSNKKYIKKKLNNQWYDIIDDHSTCTERSGMHLL